jgi:hypothetical protein
MGDQREGCGLFFQNQSSLSVPSPPNALLSDILGSVVIGRDCHFGFSCRISDSPVFNNESKDPVGLVREGNSVKSKTQDNPSVTVIRLNCSEICENGMRSAKQDCCFLVIRLFHNTVRARPGQEEVGVEAIDRTTREKESQALQAVGVSILEVVPHGT